MESILDSVKKMLGIEQEYNHFDTDIIIHINSVLMILNQLGIGPDKPFVINGADQTWSDFLGDSKLVELCRSYMYLKVRLIFDPPTTGVLHEAMERQIKEFEWRLNVQVDPSSEESVEESDSLEGEEESNYEWST